MLAEELGVAEIPAAVAVGMLRVSFFGGPGRGWEQEEHEQGVIRGPLSGAMKSDILL